MRKEEKFLVGVLLAVVVAFAVSYLVCRSRKGWYLEPGQPDECLPPAIRSWFVQPQPLAEEQWWENLRQPDDPIGEVRYVGTMISGEEAPLKQPATSTGYWFPGEMVFTVSGQPGSGFAEILIQGNLLKGRRSQLDIGSIRHIDVVTSTWSL